MSEAEQFDEILKKSVEEAFDHKAFSAKGGNATKKKMGKDHYIKMGKKSAEKRWGKKK